MKPSDIERLDDRQRLALAKELAANIGDSLATELYAASFTLKSKLPFKATSFREILMHRLSDLADAALDLYEAGRLVPAFVMTRGVVETAAMLYWLHQKTIKFLESKDHVAYDEFLMKGMLGSRDGTTPAESYNVQTAIDHLEKEYPGLKKLYARLCEFVHPNYSGAMGSYSKLESSAHVLHLGKNLRKPPLGFGLVPLIISLTVFRDYYNSLADKLMEVNNHYDE